MPKKPREDRNEIIEQALELYSIGKSLQEIARQVKLPLGSVFEYLSSDEDKFEAAKRLRGEALVGEMLEIVDNADPVTSSLARVRADARKWIASKITKQYADKQEIDIRGSLSVVPVIEISSKPATQVIDITDSNKLIDDSNIEKDK